MLDERAEADAQRFTERWIAESLDTTPLTEQDRDRVIEGVQRLYRAQGVPWPDHVVWVRSPGELAAGSRKAKSLIKKWLKSSPRRSMYARARLCRAFRYFTAALVALPLYIACLAPAY